MWGGAEGLPEGGGDGGSGSSPGRRVGRNGWGSHGLPQHEDPGHREANRFSINLRLFKVRGLPIKRITQMEEKGG